MNRAKIKGNSFIKETKKGKKERMEERKKEKKSCTTRGQINLCGNFSIKFARKEKKKKTK